MAQGGPVSLRVLSFAREGPFYCTAAMSRKVSFGPAVCHHCAPFLWKGVAGSNAVQHSLHAVS